MSILNEVMKMVASRPEVKTVVLSTNNFASLLTAVKSHWRYLEPGEPFISTLYIGNARCVTEAPSGFCRGCGAPTEPDKCSYCGNPSEYIRYEL